MCSLPRRTSSAIRRALVLLTLAAAAQGCEEERPAPPVARQQPADAPPRNPIEEILTSDPPVERRLEGTAVMVLVDSSGSMADSVLDAKGEPRPKITIARRCVLSLVRQAEQFAKKNTAVPVQLGILEFSSREHEPSSRQVLPLGAPNEGIAHNFLARIVPKGGTPIGDAIIEAKKQLDQSGLRRLHILVVTDGENTHGYSPADVAAVLNRLPEDRRAALYFIAFDINAAQFKATRDAGALVLGAANERELQQTLDYVLSGKILVEQPAPAQK